MKLPHLSKSKLIIIGVVTTTLLTGGVIAMQQDKPEEQEPVATINVDPIPPEQPTQIDSKLNESVDTVKPTSQPQMPVQEATECSDDIKEYVDKLKSHIERQRIWFYEPARKSAIKILQDRGEEVNEQSIKQIIDSSQHANYANGWNHANDRLARLRASNPECF